MIRFVLYLLAVACLTGAALGDSFNVDGRAVNPFYLALALLVLAHVAGPGEHPRRNR